VVKEDEYGKSEEEEDKTGRIWTKEKEFREMFYWLREQLPSSNDRFHKWTHWLEIGNEVPLFLD
jgi:hypothetical protein